MNLENLKSLKFIGGWSDGLDVKLWHRVNGKREIITVPNVQREFYIAKSDFNKISREDWQVYKKRGLYTKGIFGDTYCTIYSDYAGYRDRWNEWLTELDNRGIKPLEGDITNLQRFMIDNLLQVADISQLKIAFYDIETNDESNKIIIGGDFILSCAWKDYHTGEEFFEISPAKNEIGEREFLSNLYDKLSEYDLLVGYNNYGFDDEYLLGRFKYYKFDLTKWKRIATLDFYNLFERQGTFKKYDVRNRKLDTIAKAIIKRGKVEHTEKIHELWVNNKELLKEYNLEDVRLIYDMEKKLNSVGLVVSVTSSSGLLHSLKYSPAKVVDSFLLRRAVERRNKGIDFRYNTAYYRPEHNTNKGNAFTRNSLASDKRRNRADFLKDEFDIDYESVEGAYVIQANKGLYYNVHSFDFNSLYPNWIRAFNIGHDTLVSEDFKLKNKSPNGVYFRTDFVSNMAGSVEYLLNERAKVKVLMENEMDETTKKGYDVYQNGLKELANSFYGVTAQWGGRYYSKEIAEAITASGRTLLPYGEKFFTNRNKQIVIGDTDSLYIAIGENDNPITERDLYIDAVRKYLKDEFNCYKPEYLKMGYERAIKKVLVVAKKLYAMWVIQHNGKDKQELATKGLMYKKGNYPRWASKIIELILVDLLSGNYSAEHFIDIIQKQKQNIVNGVNCKDLLISARLGKDLDDYEGKQSAYVEIAKRLESKGVYVPNHATINYLVIDGEKPTFNENTGKTTKRICAIDESEITSESVYDAKYYFDKVLMQQIEDILSPAFPEINWDDYKFPKNLKRKPFEMKVKIKYE